MSEHKKFLILIIVLIYFKKGKIHAVKFIEKAIINEVNEGTQFMKINDPLDGMA